MNYLAHIALSGKKTNIMLGNFIGDFVKGNEYQKYPEEIKKGILLHRYIDTYTDNHPIATQSKRRFYNEFPKVGGIITDIVYDYFLCQNWKTFYSTNLEDFITQTYQILAQNQDIFPKEMNHLYNHLKENDWFRRYKTQEGTKKSLTEISLKINYSKDLSKAFNIIDAHYSDFNQEFIIFYNDLQTKVNEIFLIKDTV